MIGQRPDHGEGRTVAGPFSGRGMADHLLLYDAILERAGRGISGARPGHNHIGQSQAPRWRDMPNRAYNTYAAPVLRKRGLRRLRRFCCTIPLYSSLFITVLVATLHVVYKRFAPSEQQKSEPTLDCSLIAPAHRFISH